MIIGDLMSLPGAGALSGASISAVQRFNNRSAELLR
jgi:hypothetical protein